MDSAWRHVFDTLTVTPASPDGRWMNRGVAGIGSGSFLAEVGHEIPTALLSSLLTSTLGAPAAALGVVEGLAGAARFAGGALADDPHRRRTVAVGGYTTTAVLGAATAIASSVWQVGFPNRGQKTRPPGPGRAVQAIGGHRV
ncbi:hypothetical protein AB0H88_37605 [Nonomuraea sp. NPDC050680]|uniref:hypothetical protein n=1 Tax=Nonomuraea sp. NPDC050680 TaxID=3154630 RepID=UPI0033EF4221